MSTIKNLISNWFVIYDVLIGALNVEDCARTKIPSKAYKTTCQYPQLMTIAKQTRIIDC